MDLGVVIKKGTPSNRQKWSQPSYPSYTQETVLIGLAIKFYGLLIKHRNFNILSKICLGKFWYLIGMLSNINNTI